MLRGAMIFPEARRPFILANTRLQSPPHTPELALHLADEITPIWRMTEEALEEIGLPPPFWAFAWAGGQALARYLIDNPVVDSFSRVSLMIFDNILLSENNKKKLGARNL